MFGLLWGPFRVLSMGGEEEVVSWDIWLILRVVLAGRPQGGRRGQSRKGVDWPHKNWVSLKSRFVREAMGNLLMCQEGAGGPVSDYKGNVPAAQAFFMGGMIDSRSSRATNSRSARVKRLANRWRS